MRRLTTLALSETVLIGGAVLVDNMTDFAPLWFWAIVTIICLALAIAINCPPLSSWSPQLPWAVQLKVTSRRKGRLSRLEDRLELNNLRTENLRIMDRLSDSEIESLKHRLDMLERDLRQ